MTPPIISPSVAHAEDDLSKQGVPPSGGWGSLKSVASYLARERVPAAALKALAVQNKPGGFMCVGCAWAKPEHPHPAEFCENGAKATVWELTRKRLTPDFFSRRTLAELEGWTDHALEAGGRLTAPMRWDPVSDRYVEVGWDQAFDEIAAELRAIDPAQAVFYTSGRASLEASYLWQLFARAYGHNNLPDSSSMCHESTSVALPKSIGVPIGTVWLEDFQHADCILFLGQNVGVNSPRLLHDLQQARRRGVPIITFNPMLESGLTAFDNPQSLHDMLLPGHTQISTQSLQVRPAGDIAALAGLCKSLVERDDAAQASGRGRLLDSDFIAEHTHGFNELAAALRGLGWDEIEHESGLARADLEQAAATYAAAEAVIAVYGMGLTQHREGVTNVNMLVNLLLLRGNIGRPGAGICPVRGHSNVQGQRTVGITEKPDLVPLDKLKELYHFEPPRTVGLTTVKTCAGVINGEVKAFIGLGGNFLRAAPDTARLETGWRRLRLTVQVATKLNRSHVVHGEVAYLLPCLGRSEFDHQACGVQVVTTEDSTGHMHASHAVAQPASRSLLSEVAIVAGIARRTLPANPHLHWQAWTDDYGTIREAIARTWPEIFHNFNARMDTPGGFPRPNAARERQWKTENGKANFTVPARWTASSDEVASHGEDVLRLVTVRSDDQFNTTVYSNDDRLRRVHGRDVVLMNGDDMVAAGLEPGARVDLSSAYGDGVHREVQGFRVIRYNLPRGCLVGYFPELNALLPLGHHARDSEVPAGKSIPVRIRASSLA